MDDSPERPDPYRGGDLEAAARQAAQDAERRIAEGVADLGNGAGAAASGSTGSLFETAAPSPDASNGAVPAAGQDAVDEVVASTTPDADVETSAEADDHEPVVPPATEETDQGHHEASFAAFLRELPILLSVAFLLAFLLRTFVVQVFYIPSGSMRPMLEINDRIVVEKVTYRFREPVRGEVVVFEGPGSSEPVQESGLQRFTRGVGQFLGVVPANAQDFVKRVIGLPGDEIEVISGVVYVNGVALDEPYAVDDPRSFGPWIVPEGTLFFAGDNRPHSLDSRISGGLGFVDRDRVVGRAMLIVWPFDHFGGIGTPEYAEIPDAASDASDAEAQDNAATTSGG